MHFKCHRLARQRVVEVEQYRVTVFIIAYLLHCTGVTAHAVWRRKLDHVTHLVLLVGVTHFKQQLAGNPMHPVGIALAKSLSGRNVEGRAYALVQPEQALLHGGRQLARAQRQRGRLVVEGVDDVARRAGQAVMQG